MIKWLRRYNPFVVTYRVIEDEGSFFVIKHYLFDRIGLGMFETLKAAKEAITINKQKNTKLIVWEEW